MKKLAYISLAIILSTLILCGCNNKKKQTQNETLVELNEQSITEFAKKIEHGIINGQANALNNVIDQENIKQLVRENSIVNSGFDVEGGQKYFERCLHIGEPLVEAINNGGDFSFTKYYVDNNEHHIVFRSYDNFIINFYDFTVDTVAGKLLIQDGFIYNTGCLISENIQGGMLYNLMLQTNPDSDVKWLLQAETMTKNGEAAKALALLDEHKEMLKEYPSFYQLYIANLYRADQAHFDSRLSNLSNEIDVRHLLLHKLLYYVNEGKTSETENTINELITHTGDDPIFLFLYGYANQVSKQYKEALNCYETVDQSMPLIWDLWQCEILCHKKLNDSEGLNKCLEKGKKAYGMSDDEIANLEIK